MEEQIEETKTQSTAASKLCSKCETTCLLTNFYNHKNGKDGCAHVCKPCYKKTVKAHRKAITKTNRARDDKGWAEHHQKLYPDGQKVCSQCKQSRDLKSFVRQMRSLDGLGICRTCNTDRHKKLKDYRSKLKEGQNCSKCGFDKDPRCLDFAHIDRSTKTRDKNGRTVDPCHLSSIKTISAQAAQTTFLRKNCHRLETQKENTAKQSQSIWAISCRNRLKPRFDIVNAEKTKRGNCVDCKLAVNELNFQAFDFDHLPGFKKVDCISTMAGRYMMYTIKEIVTEMKKCELRCANCHAIKTSERFKEMSQKRKIDETKPQKEEMKTASNVTPEKK